MLIRSVSILFLLFVTLFFATQSTAQIMISANGVIESKSGGFKFPDGSTQDSAAPGNAVVFTDQARTLMIPGEFASLEEAFAALQKERISPTVKVTLQLAAGLYSYSSPLGLAHPDGISIEIMGDTVTPSNVILDFTDCSGLLFSGTYLSLLDGVEIRGNRTGLPLGAVGIQANAGATVNLGNNVIVDGFDIGIQAQFGGVVMAEQTTSSNNTLDGYNAFSNGVIYAAGTSASGNGGSGYAAAEGGTINARNTTSEDNNQNGYLAVNGGIINADGALATSNAANGFHAHVNGTIFAPASSSNGNSADGYVSSANSAIQANGASATGNGGSGFTSYNSSGISALNGSSVDNAVFGFQVAGHSSIEAISAGASGNTIADYNLEPNNLSADGSIVLQ